MALGFSWQQAGAFVQNIDNLAHTIIDAAVDAQIRWIVPVLYNDGTAAENLSLLPELKSYIRGRMNVGGWFNGFGGDPQMDADRIAQITDNNNLSHIILDLESAYQAPDGNPSLMPKLVLALRQHFPLGRKAIGVTTNGLNDASIWNGRVGNTLRPDDKSFRDLNIHVLPQWYNASRYDGYMWADPVENMEWLQTHGMLDNFYEPGFADHRAVPLASVHATLETTGMEEDANLAGEIARLRQAQAFGYQKGLVLYLLERAPLSDLAQVKQATDLRA